MCGEARLRKRMKNACGALGSVIYSSSGACRCVCHPSSSWGGLQVFVKTGERELFPKKMVEDPKSWGGVSVTLGWSRMGT